MNNIQCRFDDEQMQWDSSAESENIHLPISAMYSSVRETVI